jgi:hypothetical protein
MDELSDEVAKSGRAIIDYKMGCARLRLDGIASRRAAAPDERRLGAGSDIAAARSPW